MCENSLRCQRSTISDDGDACACMLLVSQADHPKQQGVVAVSVVVAVGGGGGGRLAYAAGFCCTRASPPVGRARPSVPRTSCVEVLVEDNVVVMEGGCRRARDQPVLNKRLFLITPSAAVAPHL